ncbi:MAG: phosphoribosylformylglycinamidine synthase subunit PurL, partial [Candidatus Aenigmarchaeota archaeon]|nr:phosphoribosylformylglycinamidine synthase subunit PurL [Candidatus Aenigmarchaeota archaeon]
MLDKKPDDLIKINNERNLALNKDELIEIQKYFSKMQRNPTDLEIEIFNQSWSEHCIHKTFRHDIYLDDGVLETNSIILDEQNRLKNLLKQTIIRATKELDMPWCFGVFEDNAGMVDFVDDYVIAVKVETHNHPSALEPFGGAATGVGGCIRDILGVWAEPFANTNVLCFGNLDMNYDNLPKGTKHPKYLFNGVVRGIGEYGNKMGIPTVNGAIYFDKSYTTNPLVFCGCFGLLEKSKYKREAKNTDYLVLVGGRTGKDGIHGVSFASADLSSESEEINGSAVQIGDPIEEEKVMRGIMEVSAKNLGSGITDLGGGGLSSAVGEMCHTYDLGTIVDLDKVPLKYKGLKPWEIWISESQERMLILVPKENYEKVVKIFEAEDVEVVKIGEFTKEKNLVLKYNGDEVANVDIDFLFNAVPNTYKKAEWKKPDLTEPTIAESDNYNEDLAKILSSPNVASKEKVIRSYDSTVRAGTVLGPLHGGKEDSPGDASVVKPLLKNKKGVVISCGFNPEYGKIDPYHMATSAIDEAVRNNTAVGGRRIALLDNYSWGNPQIPQNLGGLVRASQACYDTAMEYKTPFISGKDSLYNQSEEGPVTPTLVITAIGVIPDAQRKISMNFKKPQNNIYLIGTTCNELGGSHFYKIKGHLGANVPKVRTKHAKKIYDLLIDAMDSNLVLTCHDLSEGGLAVSLAEMCFDGIGAQIDLSKAICDRPLKDYQILFSESNSRFLVEVEKENSKRFEQIIGDFASLVGHTIEEKKVIIKRGEKEENIIDEDIDALKQS